MYPKAKPKVCRLRRIMTSSIVLAAFAHPFHGAGATPQIAASRSGRKVRAGCDQMDAAVIVFAANASAFSSRARLRSRKLSAHAGDAGPMKGCSMATHKENLIKNGAKVVSHARYVTFQMPRSPSEKLLAALLLVASCDA